VRSRGIFLTGTDTGAGKTLVSCAILAALRRRGLRVAACKPVETGCRLEGGESAGEGAERVGQGVERVGESGQRVGEDCERLAAAGGGVQQPRDVAAWLLAEPAAPLVAAEAEGVRLDRRRLLDHFAGIARQADFVLVESAGGLMVPVADGYTTRDFALELGLPAVVVVASRLGCINHALLTLEVLRTSAIPVAGYVVNEMGSGGEYGLALRTNRDVLRRFAGAPEIGAMPFVPEAARDTLPVLADLAEQHLDLDRLTA
jgi:dethiobiotin synthetase